MSTNAHKLARVIGRQQEPYDTLLADAKDAIRWAYPDLQQRCKNNRKYHASRASSLLELLEVLEVAMHRFEIYAFDHSSTHRDFNHVNFELERDNYVVRFRMMVTGQVLVFEWFDNDNCVRDWRRVKV